MGKFNPERDLDVNLTGKVVFVTGATSGIGFAIAQVLVNKGATVYIGARSEERAKASIKRIEDGRASSSDGKAIYWPLDLADPQGVKKSAEEFVQKEQKLDVLINNAAWTIVDHNIDSRGVLDIMTVNYFSPVVLTETLLPLLKKTAQEADSDVRIINVGTDGYKLVSNDVRYRSKEDFAIKTANNFIGSMKRYTRTKLAVLLWTIELQRRLTEEGSNIIVICPHPGTVLTENTFTLAKGYPWPISSLLRVFVRLTFDSALSGAANPLVCAAAPYVRSGPDAERYKGAFTHPVGKIVTPTSAPSKSEELRRELWETTHALLKEWDL